MRVGEIDDLRSIVPIVEGVRKSRLEPEFDAIGKRLWSNSSGCGQIEALRELKRTSPGGEFTQLVDFVFEEYGICEHRLDRADIPGNPSLQSLIFEKGRGFFSEPKLVCIYMFWLP